jgi:two-component system KDP operon response regulator KdpE
VRGRITVLVVDSDRDDLERTVEWLNAADYEAISAEDINSGLRGLYNYHPDVVVFASDLAASDGWAGVQRIRDLSDIPIILVASRANQSSLQKAFSLQLDGYLVKPIEAEELLARLAAVVRKTYNNYSSPTSTIFRHENLTIDWKRFEVRIDGRPVHLSVTEFKLLALLVERRGWVLTYDQILTHVWGPDYMGDKSKVKLYIWYLRRKLEADPAQPRWITTKYGIGYTFTDESWGAEEMAEPLPNPRGLGHRQRRPITAA